MKEEKEEPVGYAKFHCFKIAACSYFGIASLVQAAKLDEHVRTLTKHK
jgi:hypothetical protein